MRLCVFSLKDETLVDKTMSGRLINCLRSKYGTDKKSISQKCGEEIVELIKISKTDVRLDAQLYENCRFIIQRSCPGPNKEDCLKVLFQKNKINEDRCRKQVIRIIQEGKADIHTDPSLIVACQQDVSKFCIDIPIGSWEKSTKIEFFSFSARWRSTNSMFVEKEKTSFEKLRRNFRKSPRTLGTGSSGFDLFSNKNENYFCFFLDSCAQRFPEIHETILPKRRRSRNFYRFRYFYMRLFLFVLVLSRFISTKISPKAQIEKQAFLFFCWLSEKIE